MITAPQISPNRRAVVLCQSGVWRSMVGALAILTLIAQLLAPGMARASNGEWVEICSEFGTVMMQVDWSDDDTNQTMPCPKCEACTLCAAAMPADLTRGTTVLAILAKAQDATMAERQVELIERQYQRPNTRGPPTATPHITDRAQSEPTAIPLNTGDTPWT